VKQGMAEQNLDMAGLLPAWFCYSLWKFLLHYTSC